MSKYILAIDQGTTSSRAIVFDLQGHVLAMAQEELPQYYPASGWVEQNPMEILDSVNRVVRQVLRETPPEQIAAAGITNQRETTVVWDRHTGKPVHPAIVWQSRQSAAICEAWKAAGLEPRVREKTGLVIDAYFSASKIRWILDQSPELRQKAEAGDLLFGTIDTWLIWNLCEERPHLTDATNASRTLLYNIHTGKWDVELCDAMRIPVSMLPEVTDSSGPFARLREGIPLTGVAGDQQAALFGQGCFSTGMAKNTYGTGCFLLMNTGDNAVASDQGLLSTVAWQINGQTTYALEGAVFIAGAAVQWLRDAIGLFGKAAETEGFARSIPSSEGVYVVPAFTGLGAPYWDADARGAILGLSRGTGKAHLIRATLESIAYQTKDVLTLMESTAGIPLQQLKVDGGAVENDFLMQFQADILQAPVERPDMLESTAFGAACLAGLGAGLWTGPEEILRNRRIDRVFAPEMAPEKAYSLYEGWKKAVQAARSFR